MNLDIDLLSGSEKFLFQLAHVFCKEDRIVHVECFETAQSVLKQHLVLILRVKRVIEANLSALPLAEVFLLV